MKYLIVFDIFGKGDRNNCSYFEIIDNIIWLVLKKALI
jgi:hypothetical protein